MWLTELLPELQFEDILEAFTISESWKKSDNPHVQKYSTCNSVKESPSSSRTAGPRQSRLRTHLSHTQSYSSLEQLWRAEVRDKVTLLCFCFLLCFLFLRKQGTFLQTERLSHHEKGNNPGKELAVCFPRRVAIRCRRWVGEEEKFN